jgi:integrase
LEDFTFHDLRHTFASYMAMDGATLIEIADALGHLTLNMVMRYSHLTEEHSSKVVQQGTLIFFWEDCVSLRITK